MFCNFIYLASFSFSIFFENHFRQSFKDFQLLSFLYHLYRFQLPFEIFLNNNSCILRSNIFCIRCNLQSFHHYSLKVMAKVNKFLNHVIFSKALEPAQILSNPSSHHILSQENLKGHANFVPK